jgi:hypothetical protein
MSNSQDNTHVTLDTHVKLTRSYARDTRAGDVVQCTELDSLVAQLDLVRRRHKFEVQPAHAHAAAGMCFPRFEPVIFAVLCVERDKKNDGVRAFHREMHGYATVGTF